MTSAIDRSARSSSLDPPSHQAVAKVAAQMATQ
jgi:hypothetical protein